MSSTRHVLALCATAAVLAACATPHGPSTPAEVASKGGFDAHAASPLAQYPIHVERRPDELALSVHPEGLSAKQQAAVAGYARTWRDAGGDAAITISEPKGPCQCDPRVTVTAMANALAAEGVPRGLLRFDAYDAGAEPKAPVTARYERYEAALADCSHQWDDITATNSNTVTRHFGCVTSNNLAVSVVNPRDLVQPQAMTPADGLRRAVVLDKYRLGQVTSSERDKQAAGNVSNAVN